VHMSTQIAKLYQTALRLEQEHDRRPTPQEIAHEMGLTPQRVRWMLKISRYPLSLEQPVGEEQESELGALIEDESTPKPPESANLRLLRDKLEIILATLAPREARILRLRFGLQDGKSYTLEEIAQGIAPAAPPTSQPAAAWVPDLRRWPPRVARPRAATATWPPGCRDRSGYN